MIGRRTHAWLSLTDCPLLSSQAKEDRYGWFHKGSGKGSVREGGEESSSLALVNEGGEGGGEPQERLSHLTTAKTADQNGRSVSSR